MEIFLRVVLKQGLYIAMQHTILLQETNSDFPDYKIVSLPAKLDETRDGCSSGLAFNVNKVKLIN